MDDTGFMRIVGGSAKGHEIFQPKSPKTRPLSDRAREGLFNVLGDVSGSKMLDAYAGSGAVGLEAISRGAKHVTGVEIARDAAQVIRKNFYKLQFGESYKLCTQSVQRWLNQNQHQLGSFDLIFAGPPYAKIDEVVLNQLAKFLASDGLMVVEHSKRFQAPKLNDAVFITSRQYGESVLSFYRCKPKPKAKANKRD